jgi:hypothetical protein
LALALLEDHHFGNQFPEKKIEKIERIERIEKIEIAKE